MKGHLMLVLLLVGALAGSGSSARQDNKTSAEGLWNQAIAAKGGRQRLAEVHNLVVTETTSYTGNPVDPGFTRQRLYVFPSRVWEFVDHLPGKLGFSLGTVLDLEHPVEWGASASVPARQPVVDTATYDLLEGQFLYLLETAFVKPVPTRARSGMVGRIAVDVVETTISSTVPFGYHSDVRVDTT